MKKGESVLLTWEIMESGADDFQTLYSIHGSIVMIPMHQNLWRIHIL